MAAPKTTPAKAPAKKPNATQTRVTAASTTEGQQATVQSNQKVQALEMKRANLAVRYKEEKKVTVTGSPFYRPYFGNNMPIILNGIAIHVPLDGQQYEIPDSFAAVFHERIKKVDAQRQIEQRLGNVTENLESYAGEKNLINPV